MSKRSRRRLMLAASCLVVLAVCVVGVASASPTKNASESAVRPPAPSAVPTTAVKTVSADAAAAFKLLREVPPTAMPADVAAMVGSPQRFGRNPALARAINTPTGTGWVIPGDGYLCIAVPDPVDGWGTSCLPTAVAAQQGLGISLTDSSGGSLETLLVPDGRRVNASVRPSGYGVASARTDSPGSLRVAS